MLDLPNDSAIVGGLDTWGAEASLDRIDEPRLAAKLASMTGVPDPRLYAPPPEPEGWQDRQRGIGVWRFPEWFVVQEPGAGGDLAEQIVRCECDKSWRMHEAVDFASFPLGVCPGARPIKHAELDALLAVPEGYGDDVPVDLDLHARRLPQSEWRNPHGARRGARDSAPCNRQATAPGSPLAGFTRLEPVMPNVHGEYEAKVERADIALEPAWFPAVENRGEGILLQLRAEAIKG